MALLALVYLCAGIGGVSAQSWAAGYPKLQFGAAALSPVLSFPAPLGSWIPEGETPQDVIIRFKTDAASAEKWFTAGKVTTMHLQLSSFMGGDNAWSKTLPNPSALSVVVVSEDGVVSASDRLLDTAAVTWKATTGELTIVMVNIQAQEIRDSEIVVVLAASSFIGGKGPIAPRCLERNAPLYVKRVLSGQTEVAEFRGGFPSVAPIGCFGDVTVPFGVSANSWDTKRIGQSANKNGIGMDVTITVTLASRLDIYSMIDSVKSEISISGLLGSLTSDNNALNIEVQSTKFFSALNLFESATEVAGTTNTLNTGRWKQQTGTLTLTIKHTRMLPAGVPFVFSFTLKLPSTVSASSDVYVMAKTGSTIVIPSHAMESASGNSAPLATRQRTFITSRIGQLVSGGGQENTISITLMSNFDIQSTGSYISKITISGLTGSASPDSSPQYPYPVKAVSKDSVTGIFSDGTTPDRAGWFKNAGQIILYVQNGQFLRAGTEYVFSIKLLNQIEPQQSPTIHIQAATGETDTAKIQMQQGGGNQAPMFISEPTMSVAKIAQRTSSVGAQNTLTISLQSTVGIQTVTGGQISGTITILGLGGFKDATGQIMVTNQGYNTIHGLFVENAAKWDATAGKLVFELASGRQLSASKLYVFSVNLKNPDFAQASPAIQLELSGAPSSVSKYITMEKASDKKAPLHIDAPTFTVLRIGQKYSGTGVSNELTVTLKPNLILNKGYRFTIEGLTNSGTSDKASLPVTGCPGVFMSASEVPNQGRWSQSSGTLELYAAKEMSDSTNVVCSFSLVNPSGSQGAAQVSITVNSDLTGQVSKVIGPEIFRSAPKMKAPFMVLSATFLTANIGQSKPYPGDTRNRITVSLQANIAIGSAGGIVSSITIMGLTGSGTQDTKNLPLVGNAFATDVESTAVWTRAPGTLVITVGNSKTMRANTLYTFSFDLANPTKEQSSPEVSISSDGGQAISTMPMVRDENGCIQTTGDTAPLLIHPRGFLRKDIGMSASWPQSLTVLSITLQSSVAISSLPTSPSSIKISGLRFATKFDPQIPMTSSDPSLFGTFVEWNGADTSNNGHLIIKILPGMTLGAGKEYQIDVPLKNGVEESKWTPMIAVEGLGNIEAREMKYGGQDLPIQFVFTTLEADREVGITFSFTTMQKISKADSIIVSLPGFEGAGTSAGHHIWGVQSDPPAFTIESGEIEYGDSIAGGDSVAQGMYRLGSSSRTQISSSESNGEKGSTIVLGTHESSTLGTSNVYAGMQMSIAGSDSYHSIYQQTASAPGQPAVAHFYPKYTYGAKDATHVPAGATYVIHSQIELMSKEDVCAGTKVSITIPAASGIRTPESGVASNIQIRLSQVKIGSATTAIGTPDTIANPTQQFSGINGRSVQVELPKDRTDVDYTGLPWAPFHVATTNIVFVDGFRTITKSDNTPTTQTLAMLLTGYGPIRKTTLLDSVVGTTLNQSNPIEAKSNDMWLTLSSAASIRPHLEKGSFLQLKDELVRFTGERMPSNDNVIKVQRAQFSTRATSLSCKDAVCRDWVKPSTVYLENNGLSALLYSSSSTELDHVNTQSVKINYAETVDTVVGGDHVVSIGLPEIVGSNCEKGRTKCNTADVCARIVFAGCSVNPEASLAFGDGLITSVSLDGGTSASRFGQSICQAGETLVGTIVLEDGVECDANPACGTGCTPVMDITKDTLIIKHRSMAADTPHKDSQDVVRVHSKSSTGYQIVLVPPTVCSVSLLEEKLVFAPGECAEAPKAGRVLTWIDPATGGILASMYATEDGLSSMCLDFESGRLPDYPAACATSCDNTTADGNLIASKPVDITLEYHNVSTNASNSSTGIGVVLTIPITFNTALNISATRRAAPANFEYRLNGDCNCPSSQGSAVNCTISESGSFQAHLVSIEKCKESKSSDNNLVLAAVLGGITGFLVLLLCCYAYARSLSVSKRAEEDSILLAKDPEEGSNEYEGPVFVGRPVPVTPTMVPYAPMPANMSPVPINASVAPPYGYVNRGGSPILAPDTATWNNSNSFYTGTLPATLTPAARPGRSPVLDMSSSMPSSSMPHDRSLSPTRAREGGVYRSSPRQRSMSPDSRSPRSARMPYGV